MGPFYCPSDQRVYLDTSFFRELRPAFAHATGSVPAEFAQAYVIAHEIGHHVQNLLGILPKVQQPQRGMRPQARSQPHAGARRAAGRLLRRRVGQPSEAEAAFLEPGDIDAALQTAAAIGDDRLQKQRQGYVVPDCFTHGTSEQRKRWFMIGYRRWHVSACNTFNAALALMPGLDDDAGNSCRSRWRCSPSRIPASRGRQIRHDARRTHRRRGHLVADRAIVTDDVEMIRGRMRAWIADPVIDVIISTGGTGLPAAM